MTDKRAALLVELDRLEGLAREATTRFHGHEKPALSPGRWSIRTHESDSAILTEDGDTVVYDEGTPSIEQALHIAEHDPERTLRRIAGVRAVVDLHAPVLLGACGSCDPHLDAAVDQPCPTISALYDAYCGGT